MSLFSVMVTVILCSFCCCCRNCWLLFVRWCYFDDSKCRTIVFRPKIVNSASSSNDDRHGLALTLSLMSRTHVGLGSEGEQTELKTMCDNPRPSRPHSKPIPVGKR